MASMKITVDELRYRKNIYSKAAKNLREVVAVVKKASNSIGNDRMFTEVRQSMHKLCENMERRATVLEALADALVYSADTYKGAQTHSVSQVSDYRAHKTDFYGKAVHVSAAGGAAAAMAGGSAASAATPSAGGGGAAATTASTGSAGVGSQVQAYSTAAKASAAPAAAAAPAAEGNTTINVTNVYNKTETVVINAPSGGAGAGAAPAAANMSSAGSAPAAAPAASVAGGSGSGIGMFAAGAAAAVGAAGAAFGTAKIVKDKKSKNAEKAVNNELEEARKKLQAIEDEEDMLKASIAESEAEGTEEATE